MTNKKLNLIKKEILKCLTENFKGNQAIFDKKEGWQVFHRTDLDMIMNAVCKGLKIAKEVKKNNNQQVNVILPCVSGCFIVNNEKRPDVCGHYKVIYTDGIEGMEFFNGNMWLVKYKHPVKMWWIANI